MARLVVTLAATLVLVTGCKEFNREACVKPENQNDPRCLIDAPAVMCDTTCPGTDVCLNHVCVQCTAAQHDGCMGDTPACSDTNKCVACSKGADCPDSNVCLPTGGCAIKEDVAYVKQPGGNDSGNNACDKLTPCFTLSHALSSNAKTIVKLDGAVIDNGVTVNRAVTIIGEADPQAALRRAGTDDILRIDGPGNVTIDQLELSGASGTNGNGLTVQSSYTGMLTIQNVFAKTNANLGINISNGVTGTITITRSTIAHNLGGGIFVGTGPIPFDINNNFVVFNGLAAGTPSTVGGIAILADSASKLEFNTIALNGNKGGVFRGGVLCDSTQISAGGNLIYKNSESDGVGGTKLDLNTQRGGTCLYGNSLSIVTDPTNLGFKNIPNDDFHLTGTTPGTIMNSAGSCTGRDIDDQKRPTDPTCDFGADELE